METVKSKSFVFVAADFFESQILSGLASELPAEFSCTTFLGEGKKPSPVSVPKLTRAIRTSDVIVVTTTDNSEIETIAARHAVLENKVLVFVSLGFRSWERKEFAEYRKHVRLLIIADPGERQNASLLYPRAKIMATGNPAFEGFAFPTRTREEVREILGILPDEKFILVAGGKEVISNLALAVCLLEALRRANLSNEVCRIVFTLHPGHTPLLKQKNPADLIAFYQSQFDGYSKKASVTVSWKNDPCGIGASEMVLGADVAISINSSVLIQAAYLRIPAISMLLSGIYRTYEAPSEDLGWWPPCDQGAVVAIYDMSSKRMAELLSDFFCPHSLAAVRLRENQEKAYPKPEKLGSAYRKMIDGFMEL